MLPVPSALEIEPRTADPAKSGGPPPRVAVSVRRRPFNAAAVRPNLPWPSDLDPSAEIRSDPSQTSLIPVNRGTFTKETLSLVQINLRSSVVEK